MTLPIATHYGMSAFVLMGSPVLVLVLLAGLIGALRRSSAWVLLSGSLLLCFWPVAFNEAGSSYTEDRAWAFAYVLLSFLFLAWADWTAAGRPAGWLRSVCPRYIAERRDYLTYLLFGGQLLGAALLFGVLLSRRA